LEEMGLVGNSAVYSGYSFTLGFILVFRTSQSYNRFWISATSVNAMKTQWFEAASSLIVFIEMSKGAQKDIAEFKHKVVRFFSLLHASALGAIASLEDENFPIIDIQGWDRNDLMVIWHKRDVDRAEIIYRWVQAAIVQSLSSGLLNVPPPILTRVFQQMEAGMVQFNLVLQIMTIPFPFPYAQVCIVLNLVYMGFTPLVMCTWSSQPWSASLFTFICIVCVYVVDLIATELENPFGDDTNDLPVHDFHRDFNGLLVLLLEPALRNPPKLSARFEQSYEVLRECWQERKNLSLEQYMTNPSGAGQETDFQEKQDKVLGGSMKAQQRQQDQEMVDRERMRGAAASSQQGAEPSPASPTPNVEAAPSAPAPQTQMSTDELINKIAEKMLARLASSTTLQQGLPSDGNPLQRLTGRAQEGGAGMEGEPAPPWQEVFLQRQDAAHKEFLSALQTLARPPGTSTPSSANAAARRPEDNVHLRHGRGTPLQPCCGTAKAVV
jgi:predicted membrane chloride channel (bestrophin family)